jgi:hypothetical protein
MSEDLTFARLKSLDFPSLEARLSRISDGHYVIINPQTVEAKVAKPYHSIVTSAGWTLDEFNHEINNVLNRYRTNDK